MAVREYRHGSRRRTADALWIATNYDEVDASLECDGDIFWDDYQSNTSYVANIFKRHVDDLLEPPAAEIGETSTDEQKLWGH
ncbi:hypothetical protein EG68_10375 [Paragonimus skrjabini miyazakii]|uniref:Uncharacterized protein n=1 Tax=Paragonimus skrjabini miyazakii TaxID=59628 RepID=A0A8S9YU64_9TREM|nr:hypothetical protein EG68_10375 [Paragonimus skrjabini miyazakii]